MRGLRSLRPEEFREFLDSFDRVLSDADGVLWYPLEDLPGAVDCVDVLRQLGKPFGVVTNNCIKTAKELQERFKTKGLHLQENDIFRPTKIIISHLQKINCTKPIYVIGLPALRFQLQEAGFTVINDNIVGIKETISDFCESTSAENSNVGVVIIDVQFGLNYIHLQKAANFLQDPDVVFIKGCTNKTCPISINKNGVILGPGYFQDIVEEVPGRKPFVAGKPSRHLGDYIVEKLKIKDRGRVLFVGDSIQVDMGFATNAGFIKLLVLSGDAKREDILEWTRIQRS